MTEDEYLEWIQLRPCEVICELCYFEVLIDILEYDCEEDWKKIKASRVLTTTTRPFPR